MPHTGPPCKPTFFDNEIDHRVHDQESGCYYYAVIKGRVPGIYFNSNDAWSQVDRCSDAKYEKFKTKALALEFWNVFCRKLHDHEAAAFKVRGLKALFRTYDEALAVAGDKYISEVEVEDDDA
ncbi:hypothetical protein B0H14DRAFT_3851611 [Mycena olivaceomarginata]|nr:hypothetical protein B0H14DRAFT_3851611 [Mycena olivaceomarginata]